MDKHTSSEETLRELNRVLSAELATALEEIAQLTEANHKLEERIEKLELDLELALVLGRTRGHHI